MDFQNWTSCEMYGHNFEEGCCRDCGEIQVSEEDLDLVLSTLKAGEPILTQKELNTSFEKAMTASRLKPVCQLPACGCTGEAHP